MVLCRVKFASPMYYLNSLGVSILMQPSFVSSTAFPFSFSLAALVAVFLVVPHVEAISFTYRTYASSLKLMHYFLTIFPRQ